MDSPPPSLPPLSEDGVTAVVGAALTVGAAAAASDGETIRVDGGEVNNPVCTAGSAGVAGKACKRTKNTTYPRKEVHVHARCIHGPPQKEFQCVVIEIVHGCENRARDRFDVICPRVAIERARVTVQVAIGRLWRELARCTRDSATEGKLLVLTV